MILKVGLIYLVVALVTFAFLEIRNFIEGNHQLEGMDILSDFIIGLFWPFVCISTFIFLIDCIKVKFLKQEESEEE